MSDEFSTIDLTSYPFAVDREDPYGRRGSVSSVSSSSSSSSEDEDWQLPMDFEHSQTALGGPNTPRYLLRHPISPTSLSLDSPEDPSHPPSSFHHPPAPTTRRLRSLPVLSIDHHSFTDSFLFAAFRHAACTIPTTSLAIKCIR
ncbi:hypothetical protein VTO73DRAFT_12671 [Trametes versicolor]